MRIGSLCSGYGGLDMGVQAVLGGTVAWHVEYDRDPSRILAHHWPDVPNHGDVKHADWSAVEPVDVLTAGYPCQPFSHAGKRKGANDPRHLWPDVARAIGVLRPQFVILENVAGHVSLGLPDVLGDLAALGYDARWGVVRASDAGAPHQRERIFIVADTIDAYDRRRWERLRKEVGDVRFTVDGSRLTSPTGPGRPSSGGSLGAPRLERGAGNPDGLADTDGQRLEGSGPRFNTDHPPRPTGTADARTPLGLTSQSGWGDGDFDWSDTRYAEAIWRWEHMTRPAPSPVVPGKDDRWKLSPRFTEWLMGLPDGHVTDPAIGLSQTAQFKALGNGVVPQQAALALRTLLAVAERAA